MEYKHSIETNMPKKKILRTTLKRASHAIEKLKKRKAFKSTKEWLASFSKKKKKKKSSLAKKRVHAVEKSSTYLKRDTFFISKILSDLIKASADPKRIPKKVPKKKTTEKEIKEQKHE